MIHNFSLWIINRVVGYNKKAIAYYVFIEKVECEYSKIVSRFVLCLWRNIFGGLSRIDSIFTYSWYFGMLFVLLLVS